MAMTKEQQKSAAERIMAKEPMTEEERERFELLTKRPEDYLPPDRESGVRTCGLCGKEFEDKVDKAGVMLESALETFSEHMTVHGSSTPAQWTEAHRRILQGKENSKQSEKASA